MGRSLLAFSCVSLLIGVHGFVAPVPAVKIQKDVSGQKRWTPLTSVGSGIEDLYTTLPPGAKQSESRLQSVVSNAKGLLNNARITEGFKSDSWKASFSGLAVTLALLPHVIAFSYVAGVSPLTGLWSTVMLGFTAAAMGGRPGMISAASGACAVVVGALGTTYGPSYLSACAMLAGVLQIFGGYIGLGRLMRLIPHPVMLGFVNGLAIVMTKAQLVHFQADGKFMSLFSKAGASVYGIVGLTMALVKLLPKYTKVIPPSLGAVVISSLVAKILSLPLQTLSDIAGSASIAKGLSGTASESFFSTLFGAGSSIIYGIPAVAVTMVKLMPIGIQALPVSLGAMALSAFVPSSSMPFISSASNTVSTFAGGLKVLPKFGFPNIPFDLETLRIILPYAMTMAAVGSIESLLTLQLVDGMVDDGKNGSARKECIAQGSGNILSGLFGGIGGCAVVGQSIINVESGGSVSRWSGMSMALFLALGMVLAGPLLGSIPVAALVGIMLLVCQSTFSWSSLRLLNKIPKMDAFVIALVSIITVQRDLAQAVLAGTVASALSFAWKQSTTLNSYSMTKNDTKLYKLSGPLFFGSIAQFTGLFPYKREDPTVVVLDFANSRVMDHSALEAIYNISEQYANVGKEVYLRHLSADAARLLSQLHKGEMMRPAPFQVMVDPENDPVYGVAEDSSRYAEEK